MPEHCQWEILELDRQRLPDASRPSEPFSVIGRLRPSLKNGCWTWQEELLDAPVTKTYPNDDDFSDCIDNPNKKVFLAYTGSVCCGRIVLRRDWNGYGFVEDLQVAAAARGRGIGTGLIRQAIRWAKQQGLHGLSLETQDTNLTACRFYAKSGFVIGGVNTLFYANLPTPLCDEAAIFWYLRF